MKKIIRFTLEAITKSIIALSKLFVLIMMLLFSITPILATALIVYCFSLAFTPFLGGVYACGFVGMLFFLIYTLYIERKDKPKDIIDCSAVLWIASCWLGVLFVMALSNIVEPIKKCFSAIKKWLYENEK